MNKLHIMYMEEKNNAGCGCSSSCLPIGLLGEQSLTVVLLHGDLSMPRPLAVVILLPPGAAVFIVGLALIVIFPCWLQEGT